MNDVDVAELRRLLAAATAGPWRVLPLGSQFEIMGQDDLGRDDVSVADVARRPDAELAAAAVTALGPLLDRLDVAEARIAALEEAGTEMRAAFDGMSERYAEMFSALGLGDPLDSVALQDCAVAVAAWTALLEAP